MARYFQIVLKGIEEDENPPLVELATFLYDLSLVYKISRLATDEKYDNYQFSEYVLFRGSRPLQYEDQLRVEVLRHESPLELVALVAGVPSAIASILGLIQIIEKVSNFRLNREKLKEELKKLQSENAQEGLSNVQLPTSQRVDMRLSDRQADHFLQRVTNRFRKSPIKIVDITIRVIERTERPHLK